MNTTQTDPGGGVAVRIREMRRGAGLTQGALAALVSVTAYTVGSWEAGRRKPSEERLPAVAFHCRTARAGATAGERRSPVPVPREERMCAVVGAIASFAAEHGYPPTMEELMDETGFSSKSVVSYWLGACEEAGLIVRARARARAVTLTEAGRAFAEAPPESGGQPVVGRENSAPGATGAAAAPDVATDARRPPRRDWEAPLRRSANAVTTGRSDRGGGVVVPREERMRVVLKAIAGYVAEHGYPPNMQEVVDETGFSSKSVVGYTLAACEDAGLVVRARGMARAITLTEAGRAFAEAPPESGGQPVVRREGPARGATGPAVVPDAATDADRSACRGDGQTPARRGANAATTGQGDRSNGLASRIREARGSVGLTQRELAALVGVSSHTVWCWEAGRTKPTYEHRVEITSQCEMHVDELEGRTGPDRGRLVKQARHTSIPRSNRSRGTPLESA